MAFIIKEYCGFVKEKVVWDSNKNDKYMPEGYDFANPITADNALIVEIEAIHGYPYATRNNTRYMSEALKNGANTWTMPYSAPLIKHHNIYDGDVIGRILAVTYKESGTRTGTPALVFTVIVNDPESIEQIKDGRLDTVSIGSIVSDCRCSICGTNLCEESCEHLPGEAYDGQKCFTDIYSLNGIELSYVVVPSDAFAKTIKYYNANQSNQTVDTKVYTAFNSSLNATNQTTRKEKDEMQVTEQQQEVVENAKRTEELDALKVETENLKKQVGDLTTKLEEAFARFGEAEKQRDEYKLEADTNKSMLEKAEQELQELKQQHKKTLIECYNVLRKVTSKQEIEESKLQERTVESLIDAIGDMKEELLSMQQRLQMLELNEQVKNPTLANEQNEDVDVKKKKMESNVDLEQEFVNIFGEIFSPRKYSNF